MSEMTTPTVAKLAMSDVIEAMRSIQTEGDRWNLAEALVKQIPSGSGGFSEIIDQATSAGVAGNLSVNTLRLYRDTAVRWPADKRVANVSFSAHREAMVMPTIDKAAKMLTDLAKNLGPAKVTVASVRKAIAVQSGKTPAAPKPEAAAKAPVDILADLKSGARLLIGAITVISDPDDLDKLHAGLTKAITQVERLRAKKARASKPTTPAVAKKAIAPTKATAKKRGDLRGM